MKNTSGLNVCNLTCTSGSWFPSGSIKVSSPPIHGSLSLKCLQYVTWKLLQHPPPGLTSSEVLHLFFPLSLTTLPPYFFPVLSYRCLFSHFYHLSFSSVVFFIIFFSSIQSLKPFWRYTSVIQAYFSLRIYTMPYIIILMHPVGPSIFPSIAPLRSVCHWHKSRNNPSYHVITTGACVW